MPPDKKPRDLTDVILDILERKEEWKHALRHSEEPTIREMLHEAVNLGHELRWLVDKETVALMRRARSNEPPAPGKALLEGAAQAFAEFSAIHQSGATRDGS